MKRALIRGYTATGELVSEIVDNETEAHREIISQMTKDLTEVYIVPVAADYQPTLELFGLGDGTSFNAKVK